MLDSRQLPLTIRPAACGDASALQRLAALDCAEVPPGPLFIAEVDGVPWAAVSRQNLTAIADPFQPTAHVVALVRDHVARGTGSDGRRAPRRTRGKSHVTRPSSRARRIIGRVVEVWRELDYAQLRLLEIRTGLDFGARKPRGAGDDAADELEALFALESSERAA